MRLMTTWPDTKHCFYLAEHFSRTRAAYFDPEQGAFSSELLFEEANLILFYWVYPNATIENQSMDYICIIDGEPLAFGHSCPLRSDSVVQMGHFRVSIQPGEQPFGTDSTLLKCLLESNVSGEDSFTGNIDQEFSYRPQTVIHQRPGYIATDGDETEHDVLKALSDEYKHFLVWGEYNGEGHKARNSQCTHFVTEDHYFDNAREKMKNKTLTVCILETSMLIDKVCEELEVTMGDEDDFYYEEPYNILLSLAPDDIVKNENKSIPSLVLKDFYKSGLETFL